MCEIEVVEQVYGRDVETHCIASLQPPDLDYIMVGTTGVKENDKIYFKNCAKLFPNIPLLQYQHIFGEGYTVPALGVYAAAVCLQKGKIPEHLFLDTSAKNQETKKFNKILCYNQFEGKNHTFILLSK
jgi:3-oxoacyl-(acyl-carrier-protein) synthase